MLLEFARFLILPALRLESAWGPLKLLGGVWLFNPMLSLGVSTLDSADVCFESAYGVFTCVDCIGDSGGEGYRLTVVSLHYPPSISYIIFFKVKVTYSLLVAEVSQRNIFFSDKSLFFWERQIGINNLTRTHTQIYGINA